MVRRECDGNMQVHQRSTEIGKVVVNRLCASRFGTPRVIDESPMIEQEYVE